MPMVIPEDLSELDEIQKLHDTGVVVQLRNADGISPLGFGVRVAGPDSVQGQLARSRMQDDFLMLGTIEPTAAQRDEVETKMLSRVCMELVSQRPVILDGKPLTSSEADFFRLMTRFRWIRRQIDAAQGQRARFLPPSAQDSSRRSSAPLPESGSLSGEQGSAPGSSSGTSVDSKPMTSESPTPTSQITSAPQG